ncbi:unnamed protein product [Paramecium sonneborni]|uniref:P-type ATPase A domain-containing protein n=1 Tax=Paramecium sonneborni TaxID=65129 RepID=A0A8S1R319_9CILI|nr:unnamed protein product [Paramecium sonneborni]
MQSDIVVYDLTVSKIWCTMCSNKIKSSFEGQKGILYVQVNVMAERVIISFNQLIITLNQIKQILEQNHFFIVGQPRLINTDSNQLRRCQFFFPNSNFPQQDLNLIKDNLRQQYQGGLGEIQEENFIYNKQQGQLMMIQYQPLLISGQQIKSNIESFINEKQPIIHKNRSFFVYNALLEKFKKKEGYIEIITYRKFILAIILSVQFLLFCSIMPHIDYYNPFLSYPHEESIFSVYLIVIFFMTSFTLIIFGTPIYRNAYQLFFKYKMFNMDTLLTLGSLAAFSMSLFLIIVYTIEGNQNQEEKMNQAMQLERIMNIIHDLESAGLILTVITIGKYFEGKAKQTILDMQNQIFPQDQLLKTPNVLKVQVKNQDYDINVQENCDISLLEKGDLIILEKGMKLLLDGVIVKGTVVVIDSICYGQDDRFSGSLGTRLKSGADILEGSCIFQIEQVIESSMLFQIAEQLNLAQSERESKDLGISAMLQQLSQRFVLGVICVSLLVFFVWTFLIGFEIVEIDEYCVWCFPFERSISILVASCPCALGLAVPSVVIITLNLALRSGILIKKNTIFELISKVNCIIFDKTGTLFTKVDHIESFTLLSKNQTEICLKNNDQTVMKVKQFQKSLIMSDPIDTKRELQIQEGQIQSNLKFNQTLSVQDLWSIIGVLEKDFHHPIATLLFKESIQRQIGKQSTFVLTDQPKLQKNGIIGNVTRTTDKTQFKCLIGNLFHLTDNEAILEDYIIKKCQYLERKGKTVIIMTIDSIPEVILCLDNKTNLRPEAKAVITYLREKLNKTVYILSGDSKKTVQSVGEYLGIPSIYQYAEIDAEGKKFILKELSKQKQEVMMIGDGLNDILSLQEASIGVAINAKSQLNLMASDVIILNENLWSIVSLINLMKTALKVIYINLIWAFAYNLFMAPIAAGVFYGQGLTISPMISSASMSLSSIIVVLISNCMKFIKFDPSLSYSITKIHKYRLHEESNLTLDSYLEVDNTQQSVRKESEKTNQ